MKRLVLVLVVLAVVFAVVGQPAHIQAKSLESSDCGRSYSFKAWWGYGVYISHCDLQSLGSWDKVRDFAVAMVAYRFGSVSIGLWGAGFEAYLWLLNQIDHGNGIYILWPYGSGGIPIIRSA